VKYAILIYDEPAMLDAMEADPSMKQDYDKFAMTLVEAGQMRGGEQLARPSSSTVLRERDGKVVWFDGPFAETKEQLGGFFLIECETLDQALEAAGRIPSLRWGGAIEVRPVVSGDEEHEH
jgi:hypothetical protein